MDEANKRIDYFRSELLGQLAKSETRLHDYIKAQGESLEQLEKRVADLARELHNLKLAVR